MNDRGSLPALAIRRPVTVLMGCAAVILLGLVSFGDLAVDLLPEIGTPKVTLLTTADALALAPQEVERLVTAPLEQAVQTVSGVRRIASVSREGTSIITVEFPWGTDLDLASLHVREALDKVRQTLPEGVERPAVLRWDPGSEPIMGLAVAGSGNLGALRDLVEAVVVPRMEQVEGIAGAQLSGGAQREIHVTLDPDRLTLYALTVSDIENALAAANSSLQTGNVLQGLLRYQVRAMGEFRTVDEIAEVIIRVRAGEAPIRLRDLGTVSAGLRPRTAGALLDGRDAVGVLLYKEAGSNTVDAVAGAAEALAELRVQYPELTMAVAFENASFISQAIDSVVQNIAIGSVLAFLVLFLFLRDPRNPLLIGMAIPVSIVATFVLCYFSGITLNIMTLGGLALGAGLLVDNSIVVLENIFRHRQAGASATSAAAIGAREVAMAVAAATFTTIAVFLPISYVHGVAGELFAPQAWTVTFALLASLLVSLTVLPMLASRFLKLGILEEPAKLEGTDPSNDDESQSGRIDRFRRAAARTGGGLLDLVIATVLMWAKLALAAVTWLVAPLFALFGSAYDAVERLYDRTLAWALDHRALTLLGLALLLTWGVITGLALPWELMPRVQTGRFEVVLDAPPGTPYAELERMVRSLDEAARSGPEVTSTFATLGADPGAIAASAAGAQSLAPTRARLSVVLTDGGEVSEAIAERAIGRVRAAAARLADVSVVVDPQSNPMQRLLGLGDAGFEILVRGDDLAELQRLALRVGEALADLDGIADVKAGTERGNPEIRIRVDRDAAANYGVSVEAVAQALQSALQGRVPTQFVEFDRRIDIRVLSTVDRESLEAVLGSAYSTALGPVPFRELVEYERATGPLEIRRRDRVREVPVRATLSGITLSEAIERVEPALAGVEFPGGTYWTIGGEREEVEASFRSLAWALMLAGALVYMVMAAQFESLLHPFVILFSLPLGWVGVVIGLWATGLTLNVVALIGGVVLTGIIVNDGIVKIDTINRLRRDGVPLRRAVTEGSHLRLRPILMTTVTTVSALVPLALGLGAGAELQRPLAIAVIGGEATGTLLTLVVLPVIYEMLARPGEFR